jgi:hypothetical protein
VGVRLPLAEEVELEAQVAPAFLKVGLGPEEVDEPLAGVRFPGQAATSVTRAGIPGWFLGLGRTFLPPGPALTEKETRNKRENNAAQTRL